MEDMRPETRPCAHCGGTIAADDTACAGCGRAYIPDPGTYAADDVRGAAPPPPRAPPPVGRAVAGPASTSQDTRYWAMGSHLSALAGVLLGGLPAFLGPLVVWLLRRDDDPFVGEHAREALNFNLSIIAYAALAVVLSIVTLGLGFILVALALLPAFVGYIVVTVQATVAASRGEAYRYPLTIRFVS